MDAIQRRLSLPPPLRQHPLLSTSLLTTLALLLTLSIRDYTRYISLGPGGLPHNLYGWLIATLLLRPFSLSRGATTDTSDYPSTGAHATILALPSRPGPRPDVGEIVPQRQLTQNSGAAMHARLQAVFDEILAANPDTLERKLSRYETHVDALYVHPSLMASGSLCIPFTARVSRGEIGHVHADGSFHVYLSPADARVVVERGWGERHRLARGRGRWWWGGAGREGTFGVMPTYLLLYGPRGEEEVRVARTLVEAGVRWMTGGGG